MYDMYNKHSYNSYREIFIDMKRRVIIYKQIGFQDGIKNTMCRQWTKKNSVVMMCLLLVENWVKYVEVWDQEGGSRSSEGWVGPTA